MIIPTFIAGPGVIVRVSLFRAYDIRGIYGLTLDPLVTYKIAYAFSKYIVGRGPLYIGADNRHNSLPLSLASSSGATAAGVDVVDIGMAPTPLLYFSVAQHRAPGGIMVTASHNPPEYNGLKLVGEMARPLTYESGIAEVEERVTRFADERLPGKIGTMMANDVLGDYVEHITSDVEVSRKIKVVFEAGDGTAGPVLRRIVGKLGLDAQILHEVPDGNYPSGMVNPVKEDTLAHLKQRVVASHADIGMAVDVDADRFGVVSGRGEWVPGDFVIGLLALPILQRQRGATILLDIRISKSVVEFIRSQGGRVHFTKVGHSYIANEMLDGDYPLGGEISGHLYFKDRYYGYDDGIYCALRMLELLTAEGKSLEQLREGFSRTFLSPEIRIEVPDGEKFEMVKRIENSLRGSGIEVNTLDGIKANVKGGWFSIRASNTEPALVIRMEDDTPEGLKETMQFVDKLIGGAKSS
jgi:phosphomannomutase